MRRGRASYGHGVVRRTALMRSAPHQSCPLCAPQRVSADGGEMASDGERKCAFCKRETATYWCPNDACWSCCAHTRGHTMLFQAPDPRRERKKERLKQRREAEELRRRAAVSASAHAKAATRSGAATGSPLLELPEFILAAIVLALGPVAAARLACENSALLGAFGRLFRGFRNLEALEESLSADAAAVSQHLAGLQLQPQHFYVESADLAKWPKAMPLRPMTLVCAHVCFYDYLSDSEVSDSEEERSTKALLADISAAVLVIERLEVDCVEENDITLSGMEYEDFRCPKCGRDECSTCVADETLSEAHTAALKTHQERLQRYKTEEKELDGPECDKAYDSAEKDARATLAEMRNKGFAVPVRKLTMNARFSMYRRGDDGRSKKYDGEWHVEGEEVNMESDVDEDET